MTNSADANKTSRFTVSDQHLHCLHWPVFHNSYCAFDIFQKVVFCNKKNKKQKQKRNKKKKKQTKKQTNKDQFWAIHLILGYIFKEKTQKQKRQMVSDKIWSIRTKYYQLVRNVKG